MSHYQIDARGVHGGIIAVGVMADGNIAAVAQFRRIFKGARVVSVSLIPPKRYRTRSYGNDAG